MKNTKSLNKQSGFFDFGAGLLLLALFGGSAALIIPENNGSSYAEQEVESDTISDSEYRDNEVAIQTAYLEE